MKTKVLSVLYFLTGILSVILGNQDSFIPGFIAKALIIPLLITLLIVNINPLKNLSHKLMVAGLLFSCAGDIVLEFTEMNAFMFIQGLIFFLLAHVMYLTVFFRTPGKNVIFGNRIWFLVPVLVYGIGLGCYLYNDLGSMRLPVIVYTIVILTMLSGAINRIEKVNSTSYYLVLAGAILFVISDSAIALNKFGHSFTGSGIFVMSTYVFAQYLIILGYIKTFGAELH